MEDILYIVHRIPYPPNKGDKIRSYNILKYLSQHYRVHLGTFVDDPEDEQYISQLDKFAVDKCVVKIDPFKRKVLSLSGLMTGQALSNAYYRSSVMQKWVDSKISDQNINKVMLFSSPMAQFVSDKIRDTLITVMDFVDVDSEKWFQYSVKHSFPMSWLYKREGLKLRQFEETVSDRSNASLFVSSNEVALFKEKANLNYPEKVHALFNGVDTDKFDPAKPYSSPFDNIKAVVFTGAMDYWANIEAVTWFCSKVWPEVKLKNKDARFYIVGSKPTDEVKALAKDKTVIVTGFVDEVLPYLAHAHVCVAPLRIARGIQNKVLEALAMEKQVIATPEAMEGILGFEEKGKVADVCAKPEDFAKEILVKLDSNDVASVTTARDYVLDHFSWESHLSELKRYF